MLQFCCYFRYTLPQLHKPLLLASAACLGIPLEIDDANCLPICLLSIRLASHQDAIKLAQHCILIKSIFEIWGQGKTIEELTDNLVAYTNTETFRHFARNHAHNTFKLVLETRAQTTHEVKRHCVRTCLAVLEAQWQLVNVSSQNETQHVFWLIDYTRDTKRHVSESDPPVMLYGRQVSAGSRQLVSQCKQQPYRGPSSLNHELAVIMATLGHVTAHSVVLDPFVGTGTILLACALLGATCLVGGDIDEHVIRGSGTLSVPSNFTHFGLAVPDLVLLDCTHAYLRPNRFDCIVCDPPYGLRTKARSGTDSDISLVDQIIWQLILRAVTSLAPRGRLVFLMPTTGDTASVELFTHPALTIELVTLLELGKQWNRVLVVMTKREDSAQIEVAPKLISHVLHEVKLPKLSRVLEENCIGYVSAPSSHTTPQTPVHVWEIIRRNEFQNFLDNFVARGGALTHTREDRARSQLIHYAAAFDRTQFIDYLVAQHIDVNTTNSEGCTPLHIAARWGHTNTVAWLVARSDCDVEAEDNEGHTALLWAVKWDHVQIVQLLVERGVRIDALDRTRHSALHWAARFGFLDISRMLLLNCPALIYAQNNEGSTPICLAARWGHLSIVQLLLQSGADMNIQDAKGDTLLHESCYWSRDSVVRYLLELEPIAPIVPLKNKAGKTAKELVSLAAIRDLFDR